MNQAQFLYLTTIGWKTGRQHRIEIWFVDYNDKYYIISERLNRAHWVQNNKHNSRVAFTVNNKTFEGNARIIDKHKESKLAAEVSNLMDRKYRWNEGLIVELIPIF
jgi:deazaflavin-dependent oxidoreductase (nitroreductase family)